MQEEVLEKIDDIPCCPSDILGADFVLFDQKCPDDEQLRCRSEHESSLHVYWNDGVSHHNNQYPREASTSNLLAGRHPRSNSQAASQKHRVLSLQGYRNHRIKQ